MSQLSTSFTQHPDYKESEALQTLLQAIEEAAQDFNDRFDATNELIAADIIINVGGKSIAFYAGGPQMTGLHKFIQSIADENLYEVDFKQLTVTE